MISGRIGKMAEAKPFASLTSGLLARKGQAKPAMRAQAFNHGGAHDDLGWNDMGYGRPRVIGDEPRPYAPPVPEVVRQQEEIAQEFAAPPQEALPVPEVPPVAPAAAEPVLAAPVAVELPVPTPAVAAPVTAKPAVKPRSKATGKARAAFTLRLEAERHLKLRLACALTGRSAQHLVSEALERLLQSMPEVQAVAGQLPAGTTGTQQ
jgi:hypothetical protein